MSIRLCMGEYASVGYEPEAMGIKVYSLEELVFFIRENAVLLDDGFMDESLSEWLTVECKLQELGEELRKASRKRVGLKSYIGMILEYSGFYSRDINEQIEKAVAQNSGLSIYEKKKARGDALVQKGYYGKAGREYAKLLQMLPENMTILRGEIYHGCGVCLAKMFYFNLAGEYFLKAHTLTGKIDCYHQYLWTKRLSMSESEYIEFLKVHEEAYEDSVEMEHYLEEINQQWEQSHSGILLQEIRKEKELCRIAEYQNQLEERVNYLKDAYREMVN